MSKLVVAALLGALGAHGLGALAPQGLLQTERLELLSKDRKVRGEWSVSPKGQAQLTMYDAGGKGRASLALVADGSPLLALFDAEGQPRATLTGSSLSLFGPGGKTIRARLEVKETGDPAITLYDEAGQPVFSKP